MIGVYTGLRRKDISTATNLLISLELLLLVLDTERQRRPQAPFHNRSAVYGLSAS